MNQKPLIILITRILGSASEWESVWSFQPDKVMAFIRKGETVFVDLSQLSLFNFSDRLSQDDVWVINGKQYQNIKLRETLNNIAWKELNRDLNLKIHRGGGRSVRSKDFQEGIEALAFENLKALLRRAEGYSLGDMPEASHPVVQFANAIRNSLWSQYDDVLKKLHFFVLPPNVKVGIVKHRLSHLFLSIDVDLQGWRESGFDAQYGRDIVEAYKERDEEILEQARKLLYGESDDLLINSIQQIVHQFMRSVQEDQKVDIEEKWRSVQTLLPAREAVLSNASKDDAGKLFATAAEILKGMQNQHTLDHVKNQLKSNNPFHRWIVELDNALDALRNALKG